jgi:hypothetical protein
MKIECFTGQRSTNMRVVNQLYDAMQYEEEEHIRENMIGEVPWSMCKFLLPDSSLDGRGRFCDNGFFVTAEDGDTLAGIAACEINDLVFPQAVQFGIRLWVHPHYRAERIPTLVLGPQLEWAEKMKRIAWTCFNEDRTPMLRMIQVRAHDKRPEVAKLWSGFQSLHEKRLINNVMQSVAYKTFI